MLVRLRCVEQRYGSLAARPLLGLFGLSLRGVLLMLWSLRLALVRLLLRTSLLRLTLLRLLLRTLSLLCLTLLRLLLRALSLLRLTLLCLLLRTLRLLGLTLLRLLLFPRLRRVFLATATLRLRWRFAGLGRLRRVRRASRLPAIGRPALLHSTVVMLRDGVLRPIAIVLILQRPLLLDARIAIAGILSLIRRQRRWRLRRAAIPTIPSDSTLFPRTTPMVAPMGRSAPDPGAEVRRRNAVVTHRDAQDV